MLIIEACNCKLTILTFSSVSNFFLRFVWYKLTVASYKAQIVLI